MINSFEIFDLDVLSKANFIDQGYNFVTIVVRLNSAAMGEYIMTKQSNRREDYETFEEWERYKERKGLKKEDWERKIAKKLNVMNVESFYITQNISEIFTVVYTREA